jgi:hypothetical protein
VQKNIEDDYDKQQQKDHRIATAKKRILSDFEEFTAEAPIQRTATTSTTTSVETVETVRATIDNIIMDDYVENDKDLQGERMNKLFEIGPNKRKKKTWNHRPDNWDIIAEHLVAFGPASTIKAFNMVGCQSSNDS